MQFTLKIVALTFLLGLLSSSSSAQLKLTKEDDGLKGPVRTVQTSTSYIEKVDNKYIEAHSSAETASYDRQGRKTEQYSDYQKNDSPTKGKEIFVYDSQGRLQEIVKYDYNGEIETKLKSSYDEQGRLISLVTPYRIKPSLFSGEGAPMEIKVTFVYSANGKTQRYTVGLEEKEFPLLFDIILTYGQKGNLLDEKSYAAGSFMSQQTYVYDSKGRLIRIGEINHQDHRSAEELFSNDDRGNPVEISRYSGPRRALETKTLFTYEYDTAGNWVKRSVSGWVYTGTQYQEGVSEIVPRTVARRVITYYE